MPVEDVDARVVEVGRVDAGAVDRDAAEDGSVSATVDDDLGLGRPAARHGRRPGAQLPVLTGIDEARRIRDAARRDGKLLAGVPRDAGRASGDPHRQQLLAPLARVERARRARLVRRPPRPRRAGGQAPRVDEPRVGVRGMPGPIGDEPLDLVGVARPASERERCSDRNADGNESRDDREAHDLSPRRRCGLAHDEPRRQLHAQRVDALPLEQADEQAHTGAAQLGERLAHGRQLRCRRPSPAPCRRSRPPRGRPGPSSPRRCAAWSTPIATLSLNPKIAVGGLGQRQQLLGRLGAARACASRSRRRARDRAASPRPRARRGTRSAAPRSHTSRACRRSRRSGGGRG